MKNWFKKLIGISLAAVLSVSMLVGCGGKEKKEETTSETAETQSVGTEELDAKVGRVVSLENSTLVIETDDGKTLEFDVAGVNKVNRESMKEGNVVAVVYSGTLLGTETDGATVELVVAMSSDAVSGSGMTNGVSERGSQMSGPVVEYIEGPKLVIENSADSENYYFSIEEAVISDSADIEEGDVVTVVYTGDIEGDDLVPAARITVNSSGSGISDNGISDSSTSYSSASSNGFGADRISGTVVEASMNTVTIRTSGGTRYTFSTMDAEMNVIGELQEGTDITLYYTGDLSEGAETVTVTSVEVN